MTDAREIARLLAQRAPELARELLPGGRREGAEWRAGGVDGGRGKSLAIHLFGVKAGIWSDFAAGIGGDALDLVKFCQCNGDMRAALEWARAWLGLAADARPAPARARHSPPPRAAAEDERDPEQEARIAKALAWWGEAQPKLAGTPAAAYLLARGIDLAALGRQPRALRFHPRLWAAEARRGFPAMLAAIVGPAGEFQGIHRTYLEADDSGGWGKAPLISPKMSFGRVAGGTIRLWRGASGVPLAAARPGESVVIAEGIETALSVALACPELRILSGVSLGNLKAIDLPEAVGTVILCADNDAPGSPADNALRAAA